MSKELEVLKNLKENHLQFTKEKYSKVDVLKSILAKKESKYRFIEQALKRNEPMKPIKHNDSFGLCPICKQDLGRTNYCDNCGQRLDWSDEK